MKVIVLDSSALINAPVLEFKEKLMTTEKALNELKSMEAKYLALNAIKQKKLFLVEPEEKFKEKIEQLIEEKGFKRKLSETDKSILALALQLKRKKAKVEVITDDYSIQNFLKILKIKFFGILQGKIKKILEFELVCPACNKKFLHKYASKYCDFCGSKLTKKAIFK